MMATGTARKLEVRAPWDGSSVRSCTATDAAALDGAIAAARDALADPLPAHEAAAILERCARLLGERAEELAQLIRDEAGKPISLARAEVARSRDTLTFSAHEARRGRGELVPMDASAAGAGYVATVERVPVGVVAAITPFNFPLNLSCHKLGPAIAAGCSIVHKPASQVPLTALALRELLVESGLPAAWLQLVPGPGRQVGEPLATDPRIAHLSFTGSGDVGWHLAGLATRTRVALELGNSTPVIVRAGIDVGDAARRIAVAAMGYAGQSCISIQRVLVEDAIAGELTEALAAAVDALGVGDPADADTVVGPMISEQDAARARGVVDAAIEAGARLVRGGSVVDGLPNRQTLQPTILDGIAPGMDAFDQEAFAPLLGITRFATDAEAVRLANATRYGLQMGILDADLARALEMAGQLDAGAVTINEVPTFRADQMPYGGTKDSGNTREGPRYAIRELTRERMVLRPRSRGGS